MIGVVDADWDGELLHPTDARLRRSLEVARKLRQGTSPFVGKQLRHLLTEAGFSRAEGSARVIHSVALGGTGAPRAEHAFQLFGLSFLTLHYRLRRKPPPGRPGTVAGDQPDQS